MSETVVIAGLPVPVQLLYQHPEYLAPNKTGGKISVSDYRTHTITCLKNDGNIR